MGNAKTWAFAVRGEGTGTLEIDVYDDIGEDWFGGGVTAMAVRAKLKASPNASLIKLRVNSRGGDVFDGLAIYQMLAEHPARVEADVDAIAASAASVVLMAADERRISAGGMVMIHNAWGGAMGTPEELRTHADLLEKLSAQTVDIYVARSGLTKERVVEMMNATTWMTGEEAKALGFVDVVKPNKAPKEALARVDLSLISDAPEAFRSAVALAQAGGDTAIAVLEQQPPTPPSPGARVEQPTPKTGEREIRMKSVMQLLALAEDADEAAVVSAVKKIQTSARVGGEIEKLLGVNGDAALGAVRALKEAKANSDDLAIEVGKVKASLARRDFESARDAGLKDRKLTPAVAKMYSDRFEAALAANDDGSSVVADLQGFLAVAPRVVSAPIAAGGAGGSGTGDGPMQHNGKAFEAMTARERHQLKQESPELYDTLRADAVQRRAL